jgi:hypothetical protein
MAKGRKKRAAAAVAEKEEGEQLRRSPQLSTCLSSDCRMRSWEGKLMKGIRQGKKAEGK